MGSRGPAPQPTKIRVLRGNPGKRKINKKEPTFKSVIPASPVTLDDYAQKEWDRATKFLHEQQLMTEAGAAALACYCQAVSDLNWAIETIKKEGRVTSAVNKAGYDYKVKHPALQIQKDAIEVINKMCAHFGMTPSSSGRISLPGSKEKDEAAEYEAFLKNGKA